MNNHADSADPAPAVLAAEHERLLVGVARRAIEHGLQYGSAMASMADDYPASLQATGASFVTLKLRTELRGCIGTLDAYRALVADVHDNAYAAAFRDPRFPPLTAQEWPDVRLRLAVLSPPQPLAVVDEDHLLTMLQPGSDGLIFEYGERRATFLPAVWDALPEPRGFVRQLKLKMGLQADFWAPTLGAYRYTVASFGDPPP